MPIVTMSNCTVSWGGNTKADIGQAVVTISQTSITTTAIASTYMTYEAGILEGTADCDLFLSCASHSTDIKPGTKLQNFTLTQTGGQTVLFPYAIVENSRITVAPNSVVQCTMTVRSCDGAITVTCAGA